MKQTNPTLIEGKENISILQLATKNSWRENEEMGTLQNLFGTTHVHFDECLTIFHEKRL